MIDFRREIINFNMLSSVVFHAIAIGRVEFWIIEIQWKIIDFSMLFDMAFRAIAIGVPNFGLP